MNRCQEMSIAVMLDLGFNKDEMVEFMVRFGHNKFVAMFYIERYNFLYGGIKL